MHIIKKVISVIVVIINVVVSLGLIVSAYCGYIPPAHWRLAPLAVMTFGAWFSAILLVFIVDLIWWKRTAFIAGIAMIICSQQIWDFSPLNLPHWRMSQQQKEHAVSIMSYNVMQFANQDPHNPFSTNQQLDYILYESPDIVCIQEARCFIRDNVTNIVSEQLQDLSDTYRYIYIDGEDLGLLSKYDTEPIHLGIGPFPNYNGSIGAWRLKIDGKVLNLFVVHLLSYRLTIGEKDLFAEATSIESNREIMREAKADLFPKVTEAIATREEQVDVLIKVINKFGGENVVVCGDFNDTVGSYALHRLKQECGLSQVYPEVGFGPMLTYDAHHFMFRIDHILYRGDLLEPYSMRRGKIKASDHYPVTATFIAQ